MDDDPLIANDGLTRGHASVGLKGPVRSGAQVAVNRNAVGVIEFSRRMWTGGGDEGFPG